MRAENEYPSVCLELATEICHLDHGWSHADCQNFCDQMNTKYIGSNWVAVPMPVFKARQHQNPYPLMRRFMLPEFQFLLEDYFEVRS